jgi:RNA polymerase sigma factor (sigma-70 family)
MIHYSDYAIVEGLRLNSDFIIKYVYKEFFPAIRYFIKNNAGIEEDAEDIFQEALIVILSKLKDDDFELNSSFLTYLYSISKNLWLQRLKKKRTIDSNEFDVITFMSDPELGIDFHLEDQLKRKILLEEFGKLGEDCQKLIIMFLEKVSLRDIADEMGYSSEFYAKTKKYLCKEALRKMVENHPEIRGIL